MDYYGKRLATASSDKTIRIFHVSNSEHKLHQILTGYVGFNILLGTKDQYGKYHGLILNSEDGLLLALMMARSSCGKKQTASLAKQKSTSMKLLVFNFIMLLVNSISWAPHEYGFCLASASSDSKVTVLAVNAENQWESSSFVAHQIGVNAVSFAPYNAAISQPIKRLVTGGCDNLVKIWACKEGVWEMEHELEGHSDWVRDVAWAPSFGLAVDTIASCSQDRTVLIFTNEKGKWIKKALKNDLFGDCVWRLSWSLSGNVLAVSCGDNKVSLWKENVDSSWECLNEFDESTQQQ